MLTCVQEKYINTFGGSFVMPAKKLFLMISFALLTALAASALAADLNWTNADGDRLWRNSFNWDSCDVPTGSDKAAIRLEVSGPIIDSSTTAVAYQVVVGDWGSLSDSIDMTGGSLTIGSWFILGYGSINNGTVTMSAGTVSVGSNLFVGFGGTGTLNMNGGTLNIANLFGIGYCDAGYTTGQGYVYLNGGTITTAQFQMRYPTGTFGLLDITGGTLIIDGDKQTLVNDYIANGWITGYGGSGGVAVTYNNSTGKTAVTAYLDPRKARGPNPFNNAIDGTPYTDLKWTAGSGAISHDVYFDTTNPPAFADNQTETTFDPCRLELDTLYYWRIDEVNDSNIVITGDVWSFTTVSEFTTVGFLDDFNNGVIDSFWINYSTMPGVQVTEADGKLRISVAVTPPDSYAGLRGVTTYPLQSFECSVDFRVPEGDPVAELLAYGIYSDFYWQHFYDHPGYYNICYRNTDGPNCVDAGPAFGDEDTAWHRLKMIYDGDSMTNSAYIDDTFITSKPVDLTNFQIYLLMWGNSGMTAPLTVEFDNFKFVSVIPLASFTYSPQKPIVDENITFDASASYDSDGTIVSYEWAFGDGNTASGQVVAHSYTQTGQYAVTLTVMDNDGLTDSTEQDVAVKIPLVAESPDPPNGAKNVVLNKVLGWTAGYRTVSHDVYFGTDANGVEVAENLIGDLDGSGQVGYDDLFILLDYWLTDPAGSEPYAGLNDDNIVDFTDYALLVQNYMGQQPSPWFKGNTTDTSYDDPCKFALNTTYYWRVDEVNDPEKGKGDVWSFTTTAVDSNYSLIDKIMCGYQGWFNCPNDGSGRGWVHWGSGDFTPTNCTVDMWPDMTEMGPGEKFIASAFYDGNDHYVFSSYNYDTVVRHFQWMSDYGIDGVYLQRFATEVDPCNPSPSFNHRNNVLSYCKDGANMYGKKYAVMYDLSGLGPGGTSIVVNDWKYLVDTMQVGRDPNDHGYMFHNGKPVVAVWGIGFNDGRQYTLQECLDLVNFLKNDLVYGGCTVMVGVPSYWRTLSGDCVNDPMVHTIILAADIVSPWSVGRYNDSASVTTYANSVWTPDVIWCQSHNIEYLPVIFPGFSWHNLHGGTFNQIPRQGGQFLWDQVKATIDAGATMIYQAMFDEVDEGTAIFKVTNNPPEVLPAQFVTYDIDGYSLPSDEYLWLVGQATQALRGEIPANQTRPSRPSP
jgi:hypothetical protein